MSFRSWNYKSFMARCMIFICWLLYSTAVIGQQVESYTDEELTSMTDEELEVICIKRGFQLVMDDVDPATGEAYKLTHEDFVEAARKCLDIEEEMNELLEAYPELAEELEEEIRKMEEVQAQKQAELDNLQQQLNEAEQSAADNSKSSGAAFVSTSESKQAEEDTDQDEVQQMGIPQKAVEEDLTKGAEGGTEDEPIEEVQGDIQEQQTTEAEETESDETTVGDIPEVESNNGEELAAPTDEKTEDVTNRVIAFEMIRRFLKQAENDLKRIVEVMVPVIRPMLRYGNEAWKQIRNALVAIKDRYANSYSPEENENHDDAVAA